MGCVSGITCVAGKLRRCARIVGHEVRRYRKIEQGCVASGLVPDGCSCHVVASNPRVFSLLATHLAVRARWHRLVQQPLSRLVSHCPR